MGTDPSAGSDPAVDNVDLVRRFLRGQNLEQLGRREDAIAEYEAAIAAGFDSTGPYDRLISLYGASAEHMEVVRVTEAAIASVHTSQEKLESFRQINEAARKAGASVPKAAPKAASKSDG